VVVDATFDAAAAASALVKVGGEPAFKGVRRVAVTQFSAEFSTFDAIEARAGFGLGGSATQITRIHLQGLGAQEMQGLVTRLHAQFLQHLADTGLEVVPPSRLQSSAVYGRLAQAGTPLPLVEDVRIVVSPPGLGFYGSNRIHLKPQAAAPGPLGALSGLASMGSGLSAMSAVPDAMALQEDLGGGVALLEVHLRVHFTDLKASSSQGWSQLRASTEARAEPQISFAHLNLFTGTTLGTMNLERPLALNPDAFAAVRERPKTGSEKAGAAVGALLAFAAGASASTNSTTLDAVVEPERYAAVLDQGFAQLARLWTQRLQPLR